MTSGNARKAAELISLGLNAPVVALITFLALLVAGNTSRFWLDMLVTATFGTVVPLAVLYYLAKCRIIIDCYDSGRGTRWVPFVGALVSYLVGTVVLLLVGASSIVVAVMFCYLGNSFVMVIITLKWKISIHASGIAGPATALVYSLGVVWSPFFLLVILVGWARRGWEHTLGAKC
jgi:hypothetical protein